MQKIKDARTLGEKISDTVAHFGGSWLFIFIAAFILFFWIIHNLYISSSPFDPYPFILLNLVLSFVAAFQAPFILMSQHRAEKKQDQAYRELFAEIKQLVRKDLFIEKQILKLLKEEKNGKHDKHQL